MQQWQFPSQQEARLPNGQGSNEFLAREQLWTSLKGTPSLVRGVLLNLKKKRLPFIEQCVDGSKAQVQSWLSAKSLNLIQPS